MKKVVILVAVLVAVFCSLSYAAVTFEKASDTAMVMKQDVIINRSDLMARKDALEKALAEVNSLLAEADKLGIKVVPYPI